MIGTLEYTLADTQGQLFELSAAEGYDSERFISTYMTGAAAADMDKDFNHMQWAGKAYIFSRMKDECGEKLVKGEVYDAETLYWMGYLYRYWHYYTGESSKQIYRQAPAKKARAMYLSYHTMSPEMAIDRFKEGLQSVRG